MSKCIKCDVCGRTTPDVHINFSKRPVSWFKYYFDSQGGSYEKLHVCDYCWNGYVSYCQNRLASKEITPSSG